MPKAIRSTSSAGVALTCLSIVACRQIVAVDDYAFSAGGSSTSTQGGAGTGGDTPEACAPGETIGCYEGPKETENVGLCKSGEKTCDVDGIGFGPCSGQVLPAPMDDCGAMSDANCDGELPAACTGDVRWVRHYAPFQVAGALQLGGLQAAGDSIVFSIDASAPVLWNGQLTPPFIFENQHVTLNGALDDVGNLVWGTASFGPHRRAFDASSAGLFASLPIANEHSLEKIDATSGDTMFWQTEAQSTLSAGGFAAVASGTDWAFELRTSGNNAISLLRVDPQLTQSDVLALTSAATVELGDAAIQKTATGERLFVAGCYAGSVAVLNGPCAIQAATEAGSYDVFLVEGDPTTLGPPVNNQPTFACGGEPRRFEALAYAAYCDAKVATNESGRLCLAAYSRGPTTYRLRVTCFDPGQSAPAFEAMIDNDPGLAVGDDYQHVDIDVDPFGYPVVVVSHGDGFLGFDGVALPSEGAVGASVLKLDKTTGAILWKQSITSTYPHRLFVAVDDEARIYVAASLQGASRIGTETFGSPSNVEAVVASFAP